MEYNLLTEEERALLPEVLARRIRFKNLIEKSILQSQDVFSNCFILTGRAGTGKTTLILQFLQQMFEKGLIADYQRVSGHITKSAFYTLLKDNSEIDPIGKITVLMLDDCDCLYDSGCIELMKSAFDTKSNNKDNRAVYYLTRGRTGRGDFTYRGFTIIITNDPLDNPTDHQAALLDRVHLMRVDLRYEDFKIFNIGLIENYLEKNPDKLTDDIIAKLVDFFNEYMRKWFDNDIFQKAKVHFSIRLVKKFFDLMKIFGDDWKDYSVVFNKLNSCYEQEMEIKNAKTTA